VRSRATSRNIVRNDRARLAASFDRKEVANKKRIQYAENKIFALLERRWRTELMGNPLPEQVKKRMRADESFQQLVAETLKTGNLPALDDRDASPDVTRNLDGSVDSRIKTELTVDPRRYLCSCGAEIAPDTKQCEACRSFTAKL
jgi:hypothetical protein